VTAKITNFVLASLRIGPSVIDTVDDFADEEKGTPHYLAYDIVSPLEDD
jgi:hypothetical protein